jgi:hypothetical protein
MQLIDRPWMEEREASSNYTMAKSETPSLSAPPFPEQTAGMAFRELAHAWSAQVDSLPRQVSDLSRARSRGSSYPREQSWVSTETLASRLLNGWPRTLQIASIGLVFCAAIFASAHIVSAAGGLAIGFLALTVMFFGNFAAYRRGNSERLVGPTIAVIGTWGSLIIALAIGVNALLGA